jgi:phage terminase large subunit-like protein
MLDLSCRDWEERIQSRRSLIPAAAHGINPAETKQATKVFDRLRLPDVPGTPALSEAAGEWFREIVGVLLGAIDPSSGERVIRELFLLAAKKSAKTSYGAALMVTALIRNRRPRAEFLLIAPTQAVADLAFMQAAGMCQLDKVLQKNLLVQDHLKCITVRENKAQLKIKTFDTSVLTGVKPAGVLIDELHEISRNAKAARIIGQVRGGLLPIPEAFLAFITTQSDEVPAGAFRAELNMARAIRDGRTGEAGAAMLPVLYEFPPEIAKDRQQWGNPANWPMVTPNLDKSISIERLVTDFQTASYKGDDEVRRWSSQHLNIEMGVGMSTDGWPGAAFWADAEDESITIDAMLQRCEVIVACADGGGLDDLFGFALLGRDSESKDWLSWSHAWCHRSVLERRKSIASRLEDFARAGELTIIDERHDDVDEMAAIIKRVNEAGLLACVALDPEGPYGELVDALAEIEVTEAGEQIVGVPQGYKLMNAIKSSERKLANGTFWHAKSSLMDWCVMNVKIESTATAIRATKQNAGDAKIDPWCALMDGATVMVRNPSPGVPEIAALVV